MYRASKWISIEFFLNKEEMAKFFTSLPPLFLYKLGGVFPEKKSQGSFEEFFQAYKCYLSFLERGQIPDEGNYRIPLTCGLSVDKEHFSIENVPDEREIVRIEKPVIQMQPHTMDFSTADRKFRSQVLGKDVIAWGIQLSYPQIYEDPRTKEPHKVVGEVFPNTALFRQIQKWCRYHTQPTPFIYQGEKIYSSIRIGKKSFDLAKKHPLLAVKNLTIGDPASHVH